MKEASRFQLILIMVLGHIIFFLIAYIFYLLKGFDIEEMGKILWLILAILIFHIGKITMFFGEVPRSPKNWDTVYYGNQKIYTIVFLGIILVLIATKALFNILDFNQMMTWVAITEVFLHVYLLAIFLLKLRY